MRPAAGNSTPVVVLRSVHHGGLGIVRTLGRLGVPVYTIEADWLNPARFSRYCRRTFRRAIDTEASSAAVREMNRIGREIGRRAILIPTTDTAALFVAENAGALKERFLFPDQSPDLVRSLCSKKGMYLLAKSLGVPTPEASFPQSRREVLDFLEAATFPIILKAIDDGRSRRRGRRTKAIVHDRNELLQCYEQMEDPDDPNLMFQEYIPGGEDTVWMFNGYFNRDSDCLIGITGKKLRQCPVYTGPTSLGICLQNEVVERTTKDFMKAVGYRGILDIGYRYDARDGQYKVLDVNPRIGSTFRLFVSDRGMDVARALYLDFTGKPFEPGTSREGRKWIVEDFDLIACACYARDRKLPFSEWLHSYRGVQEGGCFSVDDLLPLLPIALGDAREFVRRALRLNRNTKDMQQPLEEAALHDPNTSLWPTGSGPAK
jgi:D-aspartate ligase